MSLAPEMWKVSLWNWEGSLIVDTSKHWKDILNKCTMNLKKTKWKDFGQFLFPNEDITYD